MTQGSPRGLYGMKADEAYAAVYAQIMSGLTDEEERKKFRNDIWGSLDYTPTKMDALQAMRDEMGGPDAPAPVRPENQQPGTPPVRDMGDDKLAEVRKLRDQMGEQ